MQSHEDVGVENSDFRVKRRFNEIGMGKRERWEPERATASVTAAGQSPDATRTLTEVLQDGPLFARFNEYFHTAFSKYLDRGIEPVVLDNLFQIQITHKMS